MDSRRDRYDPPPEEEPPDPYGPGYRANRPPMDGGADGGADAGADERPGEGNGGDWGGEPDDQA
jgi:hypothetical protein